MPGPGTSGLTVSPDPVGLHRQAAGALCRAGLKVQASWEGSREVWAAGVSGPGPRVKENEARTCYVVGVYVLSVSPHNTPVREEFASPTNEETETRRGWINGPDAKWWGCISNLGRWPPNPDPCGTHTAPDSCCLPPAGVTDFYILRDVSDDPTLPIGAIFPSSEYREY